MTPPFARHQPVRIKPTADCESYWDNQHDRRADCIDLRDQRVIGAIAQMDDIAPVQAFVTFEGRDGHWFPLDDLESAND